MSKLIINGEREFEITDFLISIGRAPDNSISLSGDANVSRYHAEIEKRGEDYWLIELGSSNGTTLNGDAITNEKLLRDGDLIVLGGSSEIEFESKVKAEEEIKPETSPISTPGVSPEIPASQAAIAADTEKVSKMPVMLAVTGILCGLAVVAVVAVVLVSYGGGKKTCQASAQITSPDTGDTISKETEISAEITNSDCIKSVIFTLDGKEIANLTEEPYKTTLNPDDFGDFADEQLHSLKVVLEDTEGNKNVSPAEILLSFETIAEPTPTPEPEIVSTKPTHVPQKKSTQVSVIDTQEMCKRLLKQFPGNFAYKFDSQFIEEVRKKTTEYVSEGYFARAQKYKDLINVSFVREQNLPAPLGYLPAMSRSKFNPQKQGAEEGLWRMSNEFATANSLNVMCGTETIGDAAQNCAAKVAALYMKTIFLNIFEGDTIYSTAAFGMSPPDAVNWKSTLPADHSDFWKIIKDAKQREEIVRFFAAGIVAENPQKFGLKKDRPVSELYRNLMIN